MQPEVDEERRYVMGQRSRAIIGGPDTCRAAIEAMAERYGVDEVMLLTITGDYASRPRSYELLAQAFLTSPGARASLPHRRP